MNLDILRDKLTGFLGQAVLWIVGAFLVTFTTIALLAPQSVGERISDISPVIRILFVVLLVAGSLGFVIQQIRRRLERQETGLLVKTSGAITEVDIASAKERILKVVNDLPGIVSTSATVKAIHGRADIDLAVSVSGYDVNVPGKQKEIDRALRQVVNKQLGLRMAGRPRIQIQFAEGEGLPIRSQPEIKESVVVQPVSEPVERQEKAGLGGLFGGRRRQEEEKPPAMISKAAEVEEKQPDAAEDDKEKGLGGLLGGLRLGQKHDEHDVDNDKTVLGETPADEEKPPAEPAPSTAIAVSIDTDDTAPGDSPADDADDDDSWAVFATNLKTVDDKSDQADVESWDDDQAEDKIEDEDDAQKPDVGESSS